MCQHPNNLIKAKRTLSLVKNDFTRMFPDIHPLNNSLLAAYPEVEQPRNFQWFKSKRKVHRDAELYKVQIEPPMHKEAFPSKQTSWLLIEKLNDSKSLLNKYKETKVPKQQGFSPSPIRLDDENRERKLIRENQLNFRHQSQVALELIVGAAEAEPPQAQTLVPQDELASSRRLAHHLSNQELTLLNHASKYKLRTMASSGSGFISNSGNLEIMVPQG